MQSRHDIECWLTDMDGVLVHENHALPGAAELIQQWQDEGTPYLVLTNNSIFTPRDLRARLAVSGLDVPEDDVRAALDEGRISPSRYRIYTEILEDLS